MSERLNKYLAHAGIGSRRQCDELIRRGRVSIDGKKVKEMGATVEPSQQVVVNGKEVEAERHVYWLVNKPKGYLCTNYDPQGRPRAIDLVPHIRQRVYTVGRLDEQSEGLLLLTNDGELANKLMHPRFGIRKTYMVQVAGSPTKESLQKLLDGVWLSEGRVRARQVTRMRKQGDSTWLHIVLNEGKNREIRRMLAQLDHKVLHLKRVSIGPLAIGHLGVGKSRPLRPNEIRKLKDSCDPEKRQTKKPRKSPSPSGESSNEKRRRLQKSRDEKHRERDEKRPGKLVKVGKASTGKTGARSSARDDKQREGGARPGKTIKTGKATSTRTGERSSSRPGRAARPGRPARSARMKSRKG